MEYKCCDTFMVRMPKLSVQYLKKYQMQKKDIYEFIKEDKVLDDFFLKALFISSRSLYENFVNKPKNEKQYQKLKEALLKFFLRSTLRTTPYGYFAAVGLGKFEQETSILINGEQIEIKEDGKWINELIYKLETNDEIFTKLSFSFNPNCYKSGNRLKNPYFSNRGYF